MQDKHLATELLRQDLRNGPLHCFGIHEQGSTDYCKVAQKEHLGNVSAETWTDASNSHHAQDTSLLDTYETSLTDDNTPGYIAARESRFMEDAVSENNLDDIYTIASQNTETVDPEMIWDIQQLIGRLISKASQLLGKFTLYTRMYTLCSHNIQHTGLLYMYLYNTNAY